MQAGEFGAGGFGAGEAAGGQLRFPSQRLPSLIVSLIAGFCTGCYFCRQLHQMRTRDDVRIVAAEDDDSRADQREVSGGAYVDHSS